MIRANSYLLITFLLATIHMANAQKDTLAGSSDEVVITGTRTERKLSNVAVPVKIIQQKTIQQAGSLRLTDILQEQAGLFLTSGFGVGVQMQGLNPDYTMIMINGEPLVGRTSGVLDLSRLTVGNIQKIEIVKGPSSSLYGSEAMAGVINIITDKVTTSKINASMRYGTYNTADANVQAATKIGKVGINAFVNSYSSDGFSIRPFSVERTVAPIWRLTNQLQVNFPITKKISVDINTRYAYEKIENEIAVTNGGVVTYSKGKEVHKDFNINPVIKYNINNQLKTALRIYATQFQSIQTLNTSASAAYDDRLDHAFVRVENQTDYSPSEKYTLTAGAGFVKEGVKSNRYKDASTRNNNDIAYIFTQAEWKIGKKLTSIVGLRYDDNKLFAGAFSPKIALSYKPTDKVKLTASIGRGFKAPDFRQLYLNFTNTAAGSYTVFGTLEAQTQLAYLNSIGLIQSFESDYYRLGSLKPETSTGINMGIQVTASNKLHFSTNFFYNDIQNLIDTRLVAYYKNGAQIFSYLNVKNAFTYGTDAEINYRVNTKLTASAGYQILFTGDKDQLRSIKAGNVFTKDANGFARVMNTSEYVGLPNRSKHMANIKLLYEHKSFFINLRALYRSQWAVADKDGNGVYNTNDEFAKGFVQINLSAGKTFNNGIRLQIGSDNLGNYTDINNLPNLPGRTFYTTLSYNFLHHKNKK